MDNLLDKKIRCEINYSENRIKKLLLCLCCLCSCAAVSQLSYRGGVGEELRPTGNRLSAKSGVEAKLENGMKLGATYRARTTNLTSDKMEHGFFFDINVPVWKRK